MPVVDAGVFRELPLDRRPFLQVTLFTIGHSNHPWDRFCEILQRHHIEALADIRRFPGSRKHPQFNQDILTGELGSVEIAYHWIETLGGRRKGAAGSPSNNGGLRNASFRNYADYMAMPAFHQGVDELLVLARKRRTAMMCAEGLFWQCHRRLVSDYLVAAGADVQHLFPNGSVKPHVMTAGARIAGGSVTYPGDKSLFADES